MQKEFSPSPNKFALARIDHAWSGINELLGAKALLNFIGGGGATYAVHATLSPSSNIVDYLAVIGLYFLLPNAFINSHETGQFIKSEAWTAVARHHSEEHADKAVASIQPHLTSFNMPTFALGAGLAASIIAGVSNMPLAKKAIFCAEALGLCEIAYVDAKRDTKSIHGALYQSLPPHHS